MSDIDLADRPATELLEIEITPEMIEAGIIELTPKVLKDLWDGYEKPSRVVTRVFHAMLRGVAQKLRGDRAAPKSPNLDVCCANPAVFSGGHSASGKLDLNRPVQNTVGWDKVEIDKRGCVDSYKTGRQFLGGRVGRLAH